ncbi:MAG: site-2 protease family protein [Myxococcales bacterium]|nr:site-2 protease family protein [Myxococcales bacterium]
MGRVRGIELRIHATFLVLLAWFAALAWPHGPTAVLVELGFIALLFLCVVLHELGHALTAQRYGIRTHDITLLPIGGLARLERMPTESWHELWIALAGPAVNVVIAGLLYGVLALAPIPPGLGLELLGRLAVTNVALAVFNLLPAFPMDGGRVLRAALAVRRGRLWATRRAVAVGRVFAALFAVLGLWLNPMLLLIAGFIWLAASGELMDVEIRAAAEHMLVADAMVLRFATVRGRDALVHALDELLAGTQEDFPVVEHGRVVGMLYKPDLMQGLAEHGEGAPVSAVMREGLPVLEAGLPLTDAIERVDEAQGRTLPVVRRGRLIGLLTRQNLGELIAAREALGHEHHRVGLVA